MENFYRRIDHRVKNRRESTVRISAFENPYIKRCSPCIPSMTYALGMRCTDGVILITDRKLTLLSGSQPEYIDKIQGDIPGVLWTSAGAVGEFEIFRREIKDFVQIKNLRNEIITIDGFIKKLSQTTYEIFEKYRYNYGGFEILVGISGKTYGTGKSWIGHISADGLVEQVNKYMAIGTGAPYGSIYLQEIWRQTEGAITMEEAAHLGYLIIKYIQRFQLDDAVGVGEEHNFKHPQIKFIPDNEEDYGPNDKVLDDISKRVNAKTIIIQKHIANDCKLLSGSDS